MSPTKADYSVLNKFNFEKPPVGVKFLFMKPEGIERLDKKLNLCEMPKEAQERGTPFYTDADNHICNSGAHLIFGSELPKAISSGQKGPALEIFKEPRVNRRILEVLPKLEKGIVNYTVFSPLDKMSFEPDLVIILTNETSQTELILRAMSYTTGKMWSSKMTYVVACAWVFVYPYLSGEVNYITTGLSFGMKLKKIYPEGRQLISIPYDWLHTVMQNLEEMAWVPTVFTVFTDKKEEFIKQAFGKLGITRDYS